MNIAHAQPNVLVTSVGRRVSLLRHIQHAVASTSGGKVIAVDLNPSLSAACQIADVAIPICPVTSPNYPNELLAICQQHSISLVIPTIDTELLVLAQLRDAWKTQYGITIVISEVDLVAQCRDKRQTANLFAQLGIDVPRELTRDCQEFPRFVKPVSGSRSIDTHEIKGPELLTDDLCNFERYIHQELIDTEKYTEFTVDALFNQRSELQCVVPRERLEVRDGEVSKGRTHKGRLLPYLVTHLRNLTGAYGCLTFQFFVAGEKTGEPLEVLGIELNPRFGGGYPLTQESGATFVDWIITEHFRGQSMSYFDNWADNLLMLRYDAEVFVSD